MFRFFFCHFGCFLTLLYPLFFILFSTITNIKRERERERERENQKNNVLLHYPHYINIQSTTFDLKHIYENVILTFSNNLKEYVLMSDIFTPYFSHQVKGKQYL